ncbi:hypothetical protein HID58_047399, partial [Brassica napus]
MSAKIDMLMQRDQRVVSSIEEYGEGAFFFPNQELQEQQAVVNYVDGQNLEQPNQGQQGYQNQNYEQNRPFGQSLGQNRYQNSNYNQGGFQQKQPFNSFQPKNPTQFQTGESSVPAAKESKLESMLQQLMLNQQKTASEINTKVQAEEAEAAENIPPMVRVYTPKLPYPVKQRKSRRDLEAAKCKEMVSELNVKLSFEDA